MEIDLTQAFMPEVLIVANGDLFGDAETHRLIAVAEHIVICDGALTNYIKLSTRRPDAVVGDGDSVKAEELEQMSVALTRVAEQETNDLTKAVNYALQMGWRKMAIVGASGRREDHSIGNMFLLPEYLTMGAEVRAYSPFGWMIPFEGSCLLRTEMGRELSLFSPEMKRMSARGVAYPFEQRHFTALWQATLNQVTSPQVELYSEGVAILYISLEKR